MSEKQVPNIKGNVVSGVLFGIGLMALVDEIIFHQLLQWHHFYDRSTPFIGILSDGLLNAFALFAVVLGLFMFADLNRKHNRLMATWTASFFIGLGGFQLFDGLVNHKLLQVHQVRYGVEVLPYDLGWNIAGAVLLVIGIVLMIRTRKQRQAG
ncbi:DUF2243 domain-containing protein [Salinicoccus sp. ID82-1]|uniref:DUF2243 domain-containing protein n=1 Tax=Salinicoccus cyprini TaxID=2493691 RepID=A0A558AVI0_9STAP|nr:MULTISPECIES: DUF2243 domain-containing protein [Salinicoccus]MCG1010356.1 DUF2243 domain-containing protein [Salinicoccus sp. ID82-1]TVT28255.1 DUF2243 domain-containing protein [Salinicoccus cyprini]